MAISCIRNLMSSLMGGLYFKTREFFFYAKCIFGLRIQVEYTTWLFNSFLWNFCFKLFSNYYFDIFITKLHTTPIPWAERKNPIIKITMPSFPTLGQGKDGILSKWFIHNLALTSVESIKILPAVVWKNLVFCHISYPRWTFFLY